MSICKNLRYFVLLRKIFQFSARNLPKKSIQNTKTQNQNAKNSKRFAYSKPNVLSSSTIQGTLYNHFSGGFRRNSSPIGKRAPGIFSKKTGEGSDEL
jgi:hypothetical protein